MTDRLKLWTVNSAEEWMPIEGTATKELAPNLYELVVHMSFGAPPHICLKPMKVALDKIMALPGSLTEYIMELLETFWKNAYRYKEMGLLHKRGVLLEGEPGSGKTAIALMVGKQMAERGGVAIFTAPTTDIGPLPMILKQIREIQPTLPILNIIEDLDKHRGRVDRLLPMLDGETQVPNIFHLATTNYIDKLDARITNRPGRFDEVIKVTPPGKETRRAYFRGVLPPSFPQAELEHLVTLSPNMFFAHLKELAVSTYVREQVPQETVKRLKTMKANAKTGFEAKAEEDDD